MLLDWGISALILAKSGNKVIGTDYNREIVEKLKSGKLSFRENGLQELFVEARKNGIEFKTEYVKTDIYTSCTNATY